MILTRVNFSDGFNKFIFNPELFFFELYNNPINLWNIVGIIMPLYLINGVFFIIQILGFNHDVHLSAFSIIGDYVNSVISLCYSLIFFLLFFTVILFFFRKSSVSNLVKTSLWVGYGYIPLYGGWCIFSILGMQDKNNSIARYQTLFNLDNQQLILQKIYMFGIDCFFWVIIAFFLLWSAKIWYYGITNSELISQRKAKIITTIPAVFWILLLLWNLLYRIQNLYLFH